MELSGGEPLTKEVINQLTTQYPKGEFLEVQQVVCKIFNRSGEPSLWGRNLVLRQYGCHAMDPSDRGYIWRPSRGASLTSLSGRWVVYYAVRRHTATI